MAPWGQRARRRPVDPDDEGPDEWAREIEFHIQERARELERAGWAPAEAERAARTAFGDVHRVLDMCADVARAHRRRRRWREWIGALRHDLGLALRRMRRNPAFTGVVVLTLTLGIGANHTMLRVVDQILLRPPAHIEDAEAVVRVFRREFDPTRRVLEHRDALSYPAFRAIAEVPALEGAAAYAGDHPVVGSGEDAYRVSAQWVSAEYFRVLEVEPAIGRFFSQTDDEVASPGTAVLSWSLWSRRYGADPGVLGTRLRIGSATYTVIGVAPRGFTGPSLHRTDLWLPLHPTAAIEAGPGWTTAEGWSWLRIVGRMREGATREAAQAALASLAPPAGRSEVSYLLRSLRAADEPDVPGWASVSLWLGGVSVLVWLIAAANVANLYLAREVHRSRESAIRRALGLSRARVGAQFLTEALVVSLAAAGIAALAAYLGQGIVGRVLLPELHLASAPKVGIVLLWTLLTAVATAFAAGLVPALRAGRRAPANELAAGARAGRASSRVQDVGLTLQATFSVILLVAAGLFVRSLVQVESKAHLGLDPEPVSLARVFLDPNEDAGADAEAVFRAAMDRLSRVAGVESVAASAYGPFAGPRGVQLRRMDGTALPSPPARTVGPDQARVSPGFFRTLGLGLTGRDFRDSDMDPSGERVAIASESLARLYWSGEEAVGRCLAVENEPGCTRIVGVAGNVRRDGPEQGPPLLLYLPLDRGGGSPREIWVRNEFGSQGASATVRREILAASPLVRFVSVQSLADRVAAHTTPWRLGATVCLWFGGLALLVAGVGLYSLMSFKVARGQHEIAVRNALGAPGWRIGGRVLWRGNVLVCFGIALGLAVSAFASPWIEPLLFDSSGRDVAVYAVVSASLAAVALLSSALPALRALRADPARVLRSD